MCTSVFSVCTYRYHKCAWYLQRPEEYIRTGVRGGCEAPNGCWEPGSGLLQEQQVLLPTEPSLTTLAFLLLLTHFSVNNNVEDVFPQRLYELICETRLWSILFGEALDKQPPVLLSSLSPVFQPCSPTLPHSPRIPPIHPDFTLVTELGRTESCHATLYSGGGDHWGSNSGLVSTNPHPRSSRDSLESFVLHVSSHLSSVYMFYSFS